MKRTLLAFIAALALPALAWAGSGLHCKLGSLGCTIAGVAGVLGMLAGTLAAGVPVLIAARR
jgi:hypothetical protein